MVALNETLLISSACPLGVAPKWPGFQDSIFGLGNPKLNRLSLPGCFEYSTSLLVFEGEILEVAAFSAKISVGDENVFFVGFKAGE